MPIRTPATTGEDGELNDQPDFIDEPLDPVAQDNIDVEVRIGPAQDGLDDTNAPVNSFDYVPTELEIHLTEGTQSNYAVGHLVPDGHNRKPSPSTEEALDDGLTDADVIAIDVDNELTEFRENTEEVTRIFTGILSNASRIESGLYEFMAFWPGYEEIQNGSTIVSLPPPEYETFNYGGRSFRYPVYENRWQYASIIAEDVAEDVTRDTPFGYDISITDDGTDVGGVSYGDDQQMYMDSSYVPITLEGNDEGALERVVSATNSIWEVDRYGDFLIGPPVPDGEQKTAVTSHKLRYITETSAGIRSPAWRSVVVIGDGVVSQDGWGANAQINENPQSFYDTVEGEQQAEATDFGAEVRRDELAKPVFEYVNLEIQTAEEARKVLERIKEKIRKQMAGGEITVVGHPEVWPGDAVEMPDSKNQPYGLERFGVGKVVHRLNNSDGFLTKIEVVGMTNANETTFAGQVEPPSEDERYDANYTEEELRAVRAGRRGL